MTQQSDPVRSFDGAPTFNHPEQIRHLYENGLHIDRNILREILALPHETLLDDLAAVLDDAKNRYESLAEAEKQSTEKNANQHDQDFALHALFLLQEIDCKRSLDLALGFMKSEDSHWEKNRDFINFWIGDHITLTIWQIFFHLGQGREQELADFLFVPHIDSFTRLVASTALQQIALHCPERRQSIQKLFEAILQRILTMEYDADVFACDFVSLIVIDYITTCPNPISPLVQQLFENDLVDEKCCGSYRSLMEDYRTIKNFDIRDVLDIFELYDNVVNTWAGYNPEEESEIVEPVMAEPIFKEALKWAMQEPYVADPKIGRNDPCPCGSGKKYKKCCLK